MIHAFFSFLIQKQIWVAWCFTMLALFFQIILQAIHIPLLLVLFFSTLSMYNFAVKQPLVLNLSFALWVLLPLLIAVALGLIYLSLPSFIVFVILALLSVQYSVSVIGTKFREKGSLKIFIISLVWASAIVIPTLLEENIPFSITHLELWCCVFLFTFAISIPFDLRDKYSDDETLKTMPQKYGEEESLKIANVTLILSLVFFLMAKEDITHPMSLCFIGAVVYTAYFFKRSNQFSKPNYVGFWVEASSFVPVLIYFTLQVLS